MRLVRIYPDMLGWVVFCIDGETHSIHPDEGEKISGPRWTKRILGLGRYEAAGVLHDRCYRPGVYIYDKRLTRAQADSVFRQSLIYLGCPRRTAWTAWAAVRLFGRSHWQCN